MICQPAWTNWQNWPFASTSALSCACCSLHARDTCGPTRCLFSHGGLTRFHCGGTLHVLWCTGSFSHVFEAAANDLDELTETVTSYISFCEDMCIPTRTHLTYNNDKLWFTAKLRQLCQAKEDAYKKGGKVLYKQAQYTLEKEIRVAKRNYSEKLRIQFTSSDSASVWKLL